MNYLSQSEIEATVVRLREVQRDLKRGLPSMQLDAMAYVANLFIDLGLGTLAAGASQRRAEALDVLDDAAEQVGLDVARVLVELAARSVRPLEGA